MDKSLALIVAEKKELDKILEEGEGELSDDLETFLDINQGELAVKVDNCYNWLESLDQRLASLDGIKQFYKDKVDSVELKIKSQKNIIKRFMDYVAFNMKACEATVIEGQISRFHFRKCTKRLVVQGDIPPEYIREEVIISNDNKAIKEALESGKIVGECKLEGGETLQYSLKTSKKGKSNVKS